MNDICGTNRITPFQGLNWRGGLFHRAMPYANDFGLSARSLCFQITNMDKVFQQLAKKAKRGDN